MAAVMEHLMNRRKMGIRFSLYDDSLAARLPSSAAGDPEGGAGAHDGKSGNAGSSLAHRGDPIPSGLYPYPYPVASRNTLETAGLHRRTRAQPEPTGPARRFRYAVPALVPEPRFTLESRPFRVRGIRRTLLVPLRDPRAAVHLRAASSCIVVQR